MKTICSALIICLIGACAAPPTPAPRDQAGPVVLVDEAGSRHDLDKILAGGKPVTLVFWQTWCVTCREEGPDLVRAARSYENRIEFFGVVSGPDELVDGGELREVTGELGLPYPQIRDRDGSVAEQFGVQSTPTIIVLGPGRRELYRGKALPTNWASFVGS